MRIIPNSAELEALCLADIAVAWQKSMDLGENIYHLSEDFPKQETYGLTIQVRRAAVSVPSNIAEGQAHYTNADFCRFLRIREGPWRNLKPRY